MQVLIETQYLPPIEYFCALLHAQQVVVEKYEHYVKQSYRNRCYINTANGPMKLVVPIARKPKGVPIQHVLIDQTTSWQNNHWRAIESAYGKAPFFDHYAPLLRPILFQKHTCLYNLNQGLLLFCLKALNFPLLIESTTCYQKNPESDSMRDLRSTISPKTPYQNRSFYVPFSYFQTFGSQFVSNLSIIDLLFCEGPHAMAIVHSSAFSKK